MTAPLTIPFSDDLPIPLGIVTRRLAMVASSGGGKSYASGVLVEGLLRAGAPVVILDNVGNWWGLRLSADGKKPSEFQIPILGGDRGDVALEPTHGKLVAETLVSARSSAIVDYSDFSRADQFRFVHDFAVRFLVLKKKSPSPVLLVLEEVHEVCPQRFSGDQAKTVGAVERLVKRGRNHGTGSLLISQRVAAVNKDVLNQAEAIFAFRTLAPLDRKAIAEWTEHKQIDAKSTLEQLSSLATGTCVVWSPEWLKYAGKIRVGKKTTFDSTKTPEFGEDLKAGTLAPIDLDAFKAKMGAAVAEAKANDPAELKRRIAELERQLRTKPAAAPPSPAAAELVRVEVPVVTPADHARLEAAIAELAKIGETLNTAGAHFMKEAGALRDALALAVSKPAAPPRPAMPPRAPASPASVSGPQQRILDQLAALEAIGLDSAPRAIVAVLSDASPRSSSFTNNLGALRSEALIDYPDCYSVALTDTGRGAARQVAPPRSVDELHDAWKRKLSGPQGAILDALIATYPQALDRIDVASRAGASPASSSFTNNLGTLRSLGLIDYPSSRSAVATELLFPRGLS